MQYYLPQYFQQTGCCKCSEWSVQCSCKSVKSRLWSHNVMQIWQDYIAVFECCGVFSWRQKVLVFCLFFVVGFGRLSFAVICNGLVATLKGYLNLLLKGFRSDLIPCWYRRLLQTIITVETCYHHTSGSILPVVFFFRTFSLSITRVFIMRSCLCIGPFGTSPFHCPVKKIQFNIPSVRSCSKIYKEAVP